MTTVPGHNSIIQQSGAAQELSQQAHSPKPSPEQAAGQQEAAESVKNRTVQVFDESEKLKAKKEKDALQHRQQQEKEKQKKRRQQEEKDLDPEATGRLLDTTA